MSNKEPGQQESTGHLPVVPTPPGSHSRVVLGTEVTVRMSMRPPSRFAFGGEFELWLKRFELYAKRAAFPREQWTQELMPLFEDEQFRVVDQLGLTESAVYDTVETAVCPLWK